MTQGTEQSNAARGPGRTGRPAGFVREEAVAAAMELFWRRGFLAVSAKDLADAMGIQRSSFYNSFGDREAVFREALARYAAQAPDAPLDRIRPGDPVAPALARLLREVCRLRCADLEGRGCLMVNAVAELVGVEDALGPLVAAGVRHRLAVVRRLLEQAAAQGEIPPLADPDAQADGLVTFLIGLNAMAKVVRDEDRLWAMSRRVLEGLGIGADVLDAVEGGRPARK